MQDFLIALFYTLNDLEPQNSLLLIFKTQTYINLDFIDSYANILNTPDSLEALQKLYDEAFNSLKSTQIRLSNIRKEIDSLREASEFLLQDDPNSFFGVKDLEETEMTIELRNIQEEYFNNILIEKQNFCEAINTLKQKIKSLQTLK